MPPPPKHTATPSPSPQPKSKASSPAPQGKPGQERHRKIILDIFHYAILILSVMLIVFISYDTFKGIPFLESRRYMTFQFFVCLVFIADFFVELAFAPKGKRARYIRRHWFFLLVSIPYLNLIDAYQITLSPEMLYFARFIPLIRGALALSIVLDAIAKSKLTGLFVSYISIMIFTVYFSALIFFEREAPVNPGVTGFWDAFVWCALEATSLGSSLAPMTLAGRILAVVLSTMGIIMFPLFTVYLSSFILKGRLVLNKLNTDPGNVKSDTSDIDATPTDAEKVGV